MAKQEVVEPTKEIPLTARGAATRDRIVHAAADLTYVKGVMAMANSGPNTNGSQFFIMTADSTTLPHNYTIFGRVIKGQDVVDAISRVPTENEKPVNTVYILKVTISTS